MEITDTQLFDEFAKQLCEWGESGKAPAAGNQDIAFALGLQKKRLDKHQAKMEYKFKTRENVTGNFSNVAFADAKYTIKQASRNYNKEVTYYREGRKCLSFKENERMINFITWLNQSETEDVAKETYCCPNCGAISEIGLLLEGCSYCNTRFLMSDLFPKVTHFYFLKVYGRTEEEEKSSAIKWKTIGALAGMVLSAPTAIGNLMDSGLFGMLWAFLVGGILGGIAGFVVRSLTIIGGLFKDASKEIPMVAAIRNADKKLSDFMKEYDPDFSFRYFVGKMHSLLKIYIYSDDRNNLAVYAGTEVSGEYENIADVEGAAVGVNDCRVEGDYCYIDLKLYVTSVYFSNKGMYKNDDIFNMGVCKNIRRPVDYGFSIKKVCCKGCGGSFDATREHHCPYCGSGYDLKEDDWVITYIKKR